MTKNDIFIKKERKCYQWVYAQKTKEIVDKIRDLNVYLRRFQKEGNYSEDLNNFIEEVLNLEKINFNLLINIFNKKNNFLNKYDEDLFLKSQTSDEEEKVNNRSIEVDDSIYESRSKRLFVLLN